MRTPEKVFTCGHALCNTCIRILGSRTRDAKYSFVVSSCPVCSEFHGGKPFELIPPTAGIRLLCMDGGGIRGIIPLAVLYHIESVFSTMAVPLTEAFDFIYGSSTGTCSTVVARYNADDVLGGHVALGLFLMGWNSEECFRKFDRIARGTFRQSASRFSAFRSVQRLTRSYLRDVQYSSTIIEEAFTSDEGQDIPMFNPLSSDTKVAVTTTTAKNPRPRLMTNYNGGIRPKDLGMFPTLVSIFAR